MQLLSLMNTQPHLPQIKKTATLLACCCIIALGAHAHTINYTMEQAPLHHVLWFYLKLGVVHIIPFGLDHILFVVSLCLLQTNWKKILWQATAFTVAHSITLALSTQGVVQLPAAIVEPVIALSILFVAIENLVWSQLNPGRIIIVFFFGLIHGLGFASALNEIGLPRNRFYESIIGFNLGVEIGQVVVIALVYGLFIMPFRKKANYRKFIVYPLSLFIALVAGYWTWERMYGN